MKLLRWGQSAYESDASLELEARLLDGLGVDSVRHVGPKPPMQGVKLLAVTSKVRVDTALLETAPDLELVVTTTSGFDHIDVAACQARGVKVARSPMARRDAVVDTALGMGLSLLRDMPSLQEQALAGSWARGSLPERPMRLVRGLVVGVVGHGVIGSRAAQVWRALGAQVWTSDPRMPESPGIDEIIDNCELITLHCSLSDTSEGLLDRDRLSRMRPDTVLLNTARGACVDVEALMELPQLRVGLDVFPQEPWPALAALAKRPNTLLLPHAAGYHPELGKAVAKELAGAVEAFLDGQPLPHPVVP